MSLLTESEILVDDQNLHRRVGGNREVVVRLENVSVEYRAPRERINSFKEYAIRLLQRRVRHEEFKALRNVNLEIGQGEVFGIVGHNGAGKSTLLKVVSRVMKPTQGRVWVKGRVAPLLELGAGFHPELSGRENVFLNGTLLGYTHGQMEALFESIVEFAESRDFIDSPLRTYSTGMAVRLGFAVATATRPDILIVDEVLAVGDEQFQEKCKARMAEFRQSGTTILLVTHDSNLVAKICDRAAWLDHGEVLTVSDPAEVIDQYHEARRSNRPAKSVVKSRPERHSADHPSEGADPLEAEVLKKEWFYPFDLPSGDRVRCYLPSHFAGFHDDRLAMMFTALHDIYQTRWEDISCLDIGCNQGFFTLKLAETGCRKSLGIDARSDNIADAELIRQIYGLPNLSFSTTDLMRVDPQGFEKFDVVLMFSLLFSLENPIGALKIARALTKQVLLIETPIAPEVSGQIDWGSYQQQKQLHGSFAVIDQAAEYHLPFCGLTDLTLCPGRETLIWLMKRLGFSKVEVVPSPPDAHEQLASNKRIMVAGYV
jgi:ABC-2 type transport system ATP-binding protein/lipopolysaccharide transport system ATP-binding protein